MSEKTLNLIKESNAKWVDMRFTDSHGKEQHVTIPVSDMGDDFFEEGKMFDGSSISGWKGINDSDMILMPDDSASLLDPFSEAPTVIVRCNIVEPATGQGYERDPRSVAKRAEEYLKSTGIADTAMFGPEPEFFVFDEVKWHADISLAAVTQSNLKKHLGRLATRLKAVTQVTVHVLKAVTSQYHQSIPLHDCVALCVTLWKQWICRSKYTTTKLQLLVSVRSVLVQTR